MGAYYGMGAFRDNTVDLLMESSIGSVLFHLSRFACLYYVINNFSAITNQFHACVPDVRNLEGIVWRTADVSAPRSYLKCM